MQSRMYCCTVQQLAIEVKIRQSDAAVLLLLGMLLQCTPPAHHACVPFPDISC